MSKETATPAKSGILEVIEQSILVLLFCALVGLTGTQILLRNILDSGLVWADEAIKVLVLWVAMAGALYATRSARHISIDVITRFLPLRMAQIIRRVLFVFTGLACLCASWFSYQFVLLEYEDPSIAFLNVPSWFTQAIIPLALLLMAARFIILAIHLPDELEPEQ